MLSTERRAMKSSLQGERRDPNNNTITPCRRRTLVSSIPAGRVSAGSSFNGIDKILP
jgi:hypothetical protein